MPKSQYPQQLDTSKEIPLVRDNITEIGSDVINSLRSAIFQIEKTLGINPHGSTGNTVANRISNSLDESGNIKASALALANVLSGSILDANVSSVAAIKESKLKLNYPTALLQDEISIVNRSLENIILSLNELSATLSTHIHPSAINRHKALAITVDAATAISSDAATLSMEAATLQEVLEEIYNSHINFSGTNLSETNNSHLASQIYFDNEEISSIVSSDSVQGAIEDLATIEGLGLRNALINLNSNGRIRSGKIEDKYEDNELGNLLLDLTAITYFHDPATSRTTFSPTDPVTPIQTVNKFDVLTLSGSLSDNDNKEYQINEVVLNDSNDITSITVFGGPNAPSASNLFITISKNQYATYNSAGFYSTVRPRGTRTNTPDVQIANPDSATIISSSINPGILTLASNQFIISVDGGAGIAIDTYDSSLSIQTLDSVINRINEQATDQHLNFLAYKIKSGPFYELALIHNIPNLSGDIINRTLSISEAATALGFNSILDINFEGQCGNSLLINGLILSDFGMINEFSEETIEIISGSLTLSLFSGTFIELGVRVGDLAIITGSTISSDDGSYRVKSLDDGIASLDLVGATFSGTLDIGSKVYIIRCSALIQELTFEEIESVDGTILFDVFMSDDKDVHYSKRIEVEGVLSDNDFVATIIDVSKDFIISDEEATLTIDSSGYAILTDPTSNDGASVFVAATGRYEIPSNDGMSFIVLEVNATEPPSLEQVIRLFGFDEVAKNNYHLCRGGFSTALGRILGETSDSGIPRLLDKRRSGTVDSTIIGDAFIEKYIEGPRNENRAGGIIRGCQVSNATYSLETVSVNGVTVTRAYQKFDVSAGVAIVNGIRYEIPGMLNNRLTSGITYYVAINSLGNIVAGSEITSPYNSRLTVSPFFNQNVVHLAEVTNDVTSTTVVDLRLFVDHLDYKMLGNLTVSPSQDFGHFTDIASAVGYAKRFKKLFPEMNNPSIFIKDGTYDVPAQIVIDFDLTISGAGNNTRLRKSDDFAPGQPLTGDDVDLTTAMFLIGSDQETASADIIRGVSFRNFAYSTTPEHDDVSCVFAITQDMDTTEDAVFTFDNLSLVGPSEINGTAVDPGKVGEYFIVIGQQDPNTLSPVAGVTMGNVMVKGCYMRRMGLEFGAIKLLESVGGTYKNFIITSNIAVEMSPTEDDATNEILEYPITADTEDIVESSNVKRND